MGEKIVTPKAIADGSATSIAARPPHKSPAKVLFFSLFTVEIC